MLFLAILLPLLASAYDLVDEKGLFYNIKGDGTLEVVGLDAETTEADILSDVTIGGVEYRVTSIGARAFEGRSDLTYLSIPWSVTYIGEYAFIDCGSNITVNIADPESWCKMELSNEHSSPLSSAGKVLVFDVETTNINIPEGVTSIGNFTFYQCRCITSLTIPSSVKSIGSSAFEGCTGLSSLTLSEGLESIGGSAFEGCTGLNMLRIPSTVNTISINAFSKCTSITDVYCYAVNVPVTDENAFDGTPTENSILRVPASSIDAYKASWPWSDFKEFITLESNDIIQFADAEVKRICVENWDTNGDGELSIAEAAAVKYLNKRFRYKNIMSFNELEYFTSITSIGTNEFDECAHLTSVKIPSSIKSIGLDAFEGCRNLTAVHISDIASWCNIVFADHYSNPLFYAHHLYLNDKELTDIKIPNSIKSIRSYAFCRCSYLKSIFIPNSVTSIDNNAFTDCRGLTSIVIPNSVTFIGDYAFSGCSGLTSITVESGNPKYDSRNNCNAIIDDNNQMMRGCKNTIIPNSVTSIGISAFSSCTGLTSITIPNNVTSIGSSAFSSCTGLTSITIPNDVTSISSSAFYGCTGLVYITLPSNLNSIGNSAFLGCNSLTDVYCKAETVPTAENNSFSNPGNITLYVPSASLAAYKSTEPWSKFKAYYSLSNSDLEATEKCSKPTISIVDGKFVFSCETSGVSYRWGISTSNGNNGYGVPTLPITLNVFATKSGYLNSDVATYEFNGLVGDVDGNGVVNVADHVKLSSIIMEQSE